MIEKIKKLLAEIGPIIKEIALLKRPVTATAIVAFIVTLIPGVAPSGTVIAGVLIAIGTVAAAVEHLPVFVNKAAPPKEQVSQQAKGAKILP